MKTTKEKQARTMITILFLTIAGILLLLFTGCATVQPYQEDGWYTAYELRLMYGKEQAKAIIKDCNAQYTRDNKTNRENMRSGEFEYKVNIKESKYELSK